MISRARVIASLTVAVGAIVIAVACVRDISGPVPIRAPSALRHDAKGPVTIAADARSRIQHARLETEWVGRMHTEMVHDFFAHRTEWIGGNAKDTTAICRGFRSFVAKYVGRADSATGQARTLGAREERATEIASRTMPVCARSLAMSMFGRIVGDAVPASGSMVSDSVTGVFEDYVNEIGNAVDNTDGSYDQVYSAAEGVVAEAAAAGIPDGDLNVVVAAASLAEESASSWEAEASAPGGSIYDYCTTQLIPEGDCALSLFRAPRTHEVMWPHLLIALVGVDAWGCVAGEISGIHAGHYDQSYLYGECFAWGGSASIGAAIMAGLT